MQPVMVDIVDWGKKLPFWEQVALDKVIERESLSTDDYEAILQYLLEDECLAEINSVREIPKFYSLTNDGYTYSSPVRLVSIANLCNVNALAANQTLTFGEQLTAIYGENGSGKSGYARVLASAAFTRGDRQVLPNITKAGGKANPLCADITIAKDGQKPVIHYQVDTRCHDLGSFYVFDSTSVRVHMNDQNPLSFSPAGLNYLKQLAVVTDQVRERLNAKIQACCQACEFAGFFSGDSEVNRIMSSLGPDTDLAQLKTLATLTPEEKKRRNELAIRIAHIELDKVKEQISVLSSRIRALEDYSRKLQQEKEALSDQQLGMVNALVKDYQRFQEATNLMGLTTFKNSQLSSVGSLEWRRMIEAAKAMAEREGGEEYPRTKDICPLCQQPLSTDAHHLLHQLWDFIRGQAQENLRLAQRSLDTERRSLQEIKILSMTDDLPNLSQWIGEGETELKSRVKDTISALEDRYVTVQKAINLGTSFNLIPITGDCLDDLEKFIQKLRDEKAQLESLNLGEEIKKLESEKRELDHRVTLEGVYEPIREYVLKRQWARAAGQVGGSTHHITTMHNALFKKLVTDEYVRIFERTLQSLGRPLRVKITTLGKKGQTLKQIMLEAAPDAKDIAKPEKVLSEGEKRAVALADFLTEVELDSTSNGIVLDDPVTSLDLEWRETIAKMLVEKSTNRQVIVFTHDMPFLYYLKSNAERCGIQMACHWIKRGDQDGQPGYVNLDNSPALEKDYRKPTKARELYQKALNVPPEYQEFLLRDGFGKLRTTYEAFIIFDMFEEVVMRFNERISFGRLKDIRWDNNLAAEVIETCERLSRYIEGHLHSDTFCGGKPKPEMLKAEIEKFEELQKRWKALKSKK